MTIDFKQLKHEIQTRTASALSALRGGNIDLADVNGIALVSDASAMSMALAINTRQHLAAKTAKYPTDALYLKWSPQEWAIDSHREDIFHDLSQALATTSGSLGSSPDFQDYKHYVFECAVQALMALRDEGLLSDFTGLDVLVFSAIEHDEPIETELDWIARLNPAASSQEFEDWLRTQWDD